MSDWIIARTRARTRTRATNRTAWRTAALHTGWTRIASPWRVNAFCWARWTPCRCALKNGRKKNYNANNNFLKIYFFYPLVWNWFFSGTKRFKTISIIHSILMNVYDKTLWSQSVYYCLIEKYMPRSNVYKTMNSCAAGGLCTFNVSMKSVLR